MALYNPIPPNALSVSTGTCTLSHPPSATTDAVILSANSARKGFTVWNNSTANLFMEFGAAATAAVYAVKLVSGGYYEMPFGFTGAIHGIWDAANGTAEIREFT